MLVIFATHLAIYGGEYHAPTANTNFFNLQNNIFISVSWNLCNLCTTQVFFTQLSNAWLCYLDKAIGGQYNTFFHRTCIKKVFTCSFQPTWPLWCHTNTSNSSQNLKVCAWYIFPCNFMTALLAAPMIVLYSIHRELQHRKYMSTGSGTIAFLCSGFPQFQLDYLLKNHKQ